MLNHIHDFHDPSFIETGVTENGLIRTTRGRRVDFSYEKRATLEEGERLVVDSTGDRRDTDYCYCPYKDCRSSFTLSVRLYLHIRNVHDRKFPLIKSRQERALMTMSGEKVDITANPQRKRFDAGEKLTIVYKHVIHPNQAGYRCPYYGCIRASNIRSRLFPHIREMHDPSFPVINRAHGNYIFKSGLTKREIDFKEQFMRRFDKIKVVYSNN
ncbi:hypothetical protein BDA99DRAFT_261512 [Phascolomyces articulosus]|uniref:C2H2-type domain-containing protein n=1 Tax=Phascolomyces articulosus TaxID=60185 RepID=A0AAD5JMZ6_9FUNG|nr:hypothetical protein BDA99DRAFT_261512 [Phascolomyces articulosus]